MPASLVNGKKVLAVDDEPDILGVIEEMLPMCDVVTAKSFEAARDLLETQTFDIVILDIMGVRGYDLLEIAGKRKIPAEMLTAHAFSPKDLRKSIKEGAASYIPKEEITHIKEFLEDVLAASKKGENPWKYWDERLPSSYFERRWGAAWQNTDKAFWETFKASIKARGARAEKKEPSES
jgi:DNA-binding NtrC family response regulator